MGRLVFEESTEAARGAEADAVGNGVHGELRMQQQIAGPFRPQFGAILCHRHAADALEGVLELGFAHVHHVGQLLHIFIFLQMVTNVLLEDFDAVLIFSADCHDAAFPSAM